MSLYVGICQCDCQTTHLHQCFFWQTCLLLSHTWFVRILKIQEVLIIFSHFSKCFLRMLDFVFWCYLRPVWDHSPWASGSLSTRETCTSQGVLAAQCFVPPSLWPRVLFSAGSCDASIDPRWWRVSDRGKRTRIRNSSDGEHHRRESGDRCLRFLRGWIL